MANWNNQHTTIETSKGDITFKSKLEARYAQYLEILKSYCEAVEDWEYEPKKFEFPVRSGTVFYLPDFKVIYYSGLIEWHECKGYLTAKDRTKYKRMNQYFPDDPVVLVMQNIPAGNKPKTRKALDLLNQCKPYLLRVEDARILFRQCGIK